MRSVRDAAVVAAGYALAVSAGVALLVSLHAAWVSRRAALAHVELQRTRLRLAHDADTDHATVTRLSERRPS